MSNVSSQDTMRHFSFLLLMLLCASQASGADFVVEDEALSEVPSQIAKAINASEAEPVNDGLGKRCNFIGKTFDLQSAGSKADWIATTDDACGWAASAAPVWVLKKEQSGYRVVLSFVTYDLAVGKDAEKGMRNLATGRSTARRAESQLWKYDGKKYVIAKNRVKELP